MKKIYLLFLLFTSFFANAQEPFITTWELPSYNLSIVVPIVYDENNDFSIDMGDGTIFTGQQGPVEYTYDMAGTYTITISGDFSQIRFPNDGYQNMYIKSIDQWGDTQWTSMNEAFYGCTQMVVNATDSPNLSQVTDLRRMFRSCSSLNQSLNNWDVSNVTDMEEMFCFATAFNQPLDNWDVSNVTNMKGMFASCSVFDQPLANWDVSNVTTMERMFQSAYAFNQPLNDWDVSNVTNMISMFNWADVFNQPVENWDLSSAITLSGMFGNAFAFNQPIGEWDVSNVEDISYVVSGASMFNQPLNSWDVSNVTNMEGVFYGSSYNHPLENWDVSNVTNMRAMFAANLVFNQPISNWDVSNVTDMSDMFSVTQSFNQPIGNWDVSNVTNMYNMFWHNEIFNQPLNDWNISNVTQMLGMFSNASAFNQDLSNWNFNSQINFYSFDSSGLDSDNYDALILKFIQLGFEDKYVYAAGLRYCDSGAHNHLTDTLGWELYEDYIDPVCIGNIVSGTVLYDLNNNGCSVGDVPVENLLVAADNGTYSYSTLIAPDSEYSLQIPEGTYSVELLNLPDYFSVDPISSEIVFFGISNTETLNFCLTANETINDLNITLLPLEEARPGFETEYQLVVQNMGTQTVAAATVTLSFDDTLQTFLSADPTPASTTANQLTFALADLQPFESRMINLTTELFTPPAVNGGEQSIFTATVTPNDDDYTPADNTFVLQQDVVNSYDPNDKTVLQGERIYTEQADEYLNYIIRFQNTGTASAITVRIEDILHENLDWTTFTPVSASHGYRVEITDGNLVEFIFDDINLPHEAADAEGSNGFIAYKIRPVADIQVGEMMEGNASIFFDYNLPIITNVATTEVIAHMEVSVAQINASCNGESDGSAEVNVSGGSGEYSYEWSSDQGTEPTAEGLAAGEYTVTITDSYEESITLPITITQPGAVAVSSQPVDDATTIGGTAAFSVTASNVEEYQWQVSPDGENWTSINDGGTAPSYSGTGTPVLNISGAPLAYDGYLYRALLENGEDCETYSSAGVLEVSDVAGLEGLDKLTVTMYPNPAKSEVFITIPQRAGHDNLRLGVYDISGRQLIERPVSADLEKVDLSGFASGMYLFTISSATGRFTKQIIKE